MLLWGHKLPTSDGAEKSGSLKLTELTFHDTHHLLLSSTCRLVLPSLEALTIQQVWGSDKHGEWITSNQSQREWRAHGGCLTAFLFGLKAFWSRLWGKQSVYWFLLRKETRSVSTSLSPHQDPATYCYPLVLRGTVRNRCFFSRLRLFKKQLLYTPPQNVFLLCHAAVFPRYPLTPAAGGQTAFLQWLAFWGRHAHHTHAGCSLLLLLWSQNHSSPPCHYSSQKSQLRQVQGTGTGLLNPRTRNSHSCCSLEGSTGNQETKCKLGAWFWGRNETKGRDLQELSRGNANRVTSSQEAWQPILLFAPGKHWAVELLSLAV